MTLFAHVRKSLTQGINERLSNTQQSLGHARLRTQTRVQTRSRQGRTEDPLMMFSCIGDEIRFRLVWAKIPTKSISWPLRSVLRPCTTDRLRTSCLGSLARERLAHEQAGIIDCEGEARQSCMLDGGGVLKGEQLQGLGCYEMKFNNQSQRCQSKAHREVIAKQSAHLYWAYKESACPNITSGFSARLYSSINF